MDIAYIVTAVVVSILLVVTARSKLVRAAEVTETLHRVGVPDRMFAVLAGLQVAGAVGLLIGILVRPLGVAAAIGVVLFFAGAVVAHLRVNDAKGAPIPAGLATISVAPLVLGVITL